MKQNITLSLEKTLLKKARSLAAEQGTSVSSMLAQDLKRIVEDHEAYQRAKWSALALMENSRFSLGGEGIPDREALHDRKGLR